MNRKEYEHAHGETGCEAPVGGHPLRPWAEDEAEAYFSALDYAFDKFGTPEKIQPLPVARVYKTKFSWLRRVLRL